MTVDDLRAALRQMRQLQVAADSCVSEAAAILQGRMHHLSPYTLRQLKKELERYNMHTGRWRP
jgi:hypothetical protein